MTTVPAVSRGMPISGPPTPPAPFTQRPGAYAGVPIPLDPTLEAAGAFYNDQGELVRAWRIHAGPADLVYNAAGVVVRKIQKYWTRYRHVAPPGMSIEEARLHGLDFYHRDLGWIVAGVKRAKDYPENLGTGHLVGEIETEEVEVAPSDTLMPTGKSR